MDEKPPRQPDERRVHVALRSLVDDMMTQIRAAVGHDAWTAEERMRAEADLARIMEQVRQEALTSGRD